MKRAMASVLVLAMTATAVADPHKILVLQTEGRADATTRAKIDTALVRLAASPGKDVSPGEITFTDAAAAVGCKPELPACRDEVLGMLTVDEVVYATTTPKPGGLEVEVHRVTRGGVTRDAKVMLASGQSMDSLDSLAPLFTESKAVEPAVTPTPPGPNQPPPPLVLSAAVEPQASSIVTQPPQEQQVDQGAPKPSRLPLIGMIGGGVSVTIGFLLWGEAQTIQEEVDGHPTATAQQIADLQDLEARGDSYAGWGNLLFLSGLAVGAVSTYFFLRNRKRASALQAARIAPAVFDHGGGITLTIGGSP